MLTKMNALRYRGLVGDDVQIVARATNNGGAESAEFEYDGAEPDDANFGQSPGCRITVLSGNHQFQTIVTFNGGAAARYDLFQVDETGALEPLDQHVENDGSDPLIAFTISGAAAMAKAAKAPKKAKKSVKKTAKKSTKSSKKTTKGKKTTKKVNKATKAINKTKAAVKKTKKAAE